MIQTVKKVLKSNAFGRWLFPKVGFFWHLYKDPARRRALRKYGHSVLEEIVSIANKENLEVYPIYGTLLGFVRDGGFMKHDDDIDLAVMPGKSAKDILAVFLKYGFKYIHGLSFKGICTEFTLKHKSGLTVDFFLMQDSGRDLLSSVYFWKNGEPYTDIRQNNLKWVRHPYVSGREVFMLEGVEVPIPKNSEDWLFYAFGKGWKVPDPNYTDASGQPGKILVEGYGYTITCEEILNDNIPY